MSYSLISLLARQSLKQTSEVTFTLEGYPVVKIPVNKVIEYGHYCYFFMIFQIVITMIYRKRQYTMRKVLCDLDILDFN